MKNFNEWNDLQKSAFVCWLVGGLFIVFPSLLLWRAFQMTGAERSAPGCLLLLILGVIALATGGTLYQLGADRESRHKD